MASLKSVVEEARRIIGNGKYSYGQSRKEGYLEDDFMDCSEFVYHSYFNAGYVAFPPINSKEMLKFSEVTEPQAGDIVYWEIGHVAIVEDPATGAFLGAQSKKSGLRRDNYKNGWWASQPGRKFLHYSGN